jgi:hypothetical protein
VRSAAARPLSASCSTTMRTLPGPPSFKVFVSLPPLLTACFLLSS